MVLDSKIELLREHFCITEVNDWRTVQPIEILSVDGIGDATLNHLRLHLAAHGVTLRDDETPMFWQTHLASAKIGTVQVSDQDKYKVSDFTIVIDTQEKHPFRFEGLKTDASENRAKAGVMPVMVRTKIETLGPTHGDYTLAGFEGLVHVERKSQQDAEGTFTGYGERLQRFERTLEFLEGIENGAVVVECSFGQLLDEAGSRSQKPAKDVQKGLHRQIMAWQMDYRVPWFFCDTRRLAEITTFRFFQRFFRKALEAQKAAASEVM